MLRHRRIFQQERASENEAPYVGREGEITYVDNKLYFNHGALVEVNNSLKFEGDVVRCSKVFSNFLTDKKVMVYLASNVTFVRKSVMILSCSLYDEHTRSFILHCLGDLNVHKS